jgi:glycosyltransferase involved in cell wall biosynthesis
MRILFFSHYFYPEVNAPASRTFEHSKEWCRMGHEVTVVTSFPNAPEGVLYEGYKNKLYRTEDIQGMKVLRVWTFIAANKGFLRRTLNYLSYMVSSLQAVLRVKKTDVVIATSPQIFCALSGWLASVLRHRPFILEIRDLWPESIIAVEAVKNGLMIGFLKKVELFLYNRAKMIISLTDSFKEYMINIGIDGKKIQVIKNGVDLDFFVPGDKNERLKKSLDLDGRWIISYIGTIGMAHGLKQVCDVAERVAARNIAFLLIGSGAEKEKLKEYVDNKGIKNVVFIDRQPKNMVKEYYSITDASLITLKKNNLFKTVLPSKIFESMAMKKPILLGVDGEARNLVESDARAGLYFEPDSMDDMERKINALHQNAELCHLLGENGRKFVENNFNRIELAQKYVSALEEMLKGK